MNMPFIDKTGRVVGWTSISPEIVRGKIRHPEAVSYFPGALEPNYVELTDPAHLAEAGAPAEWTGSWRCIGLCEIASGAANADVPAAPPVASPGSLPNIESPRSPMPTEHRAFAAMYDRILEWPSAPPNLSRAHR